VPEPRICPNRYIAPGPAIRVKLDPVPAAEPSWLAAPFADLPDDVQNCAQHARSGQVHSPRRVRRSCSVELNRTSLISIRAACHTSYDWY
jgi:hypothetical protein